MPTNTKQACDACRRRKVRCDGRNPCLRCKQTELACTFLIVPKKKGRRGERANVLTELRAAQGQTHQQPEIQTPSTPSSMQIGYGDGKFRITRPRARPRAPDFQRTPDLLPFGIVNVCTEFFFARLHSTVPILHRDMLQREVALMHESLPSYCLIVAFCAFVIVQTGVMVGSSSPPSPSNNTDNNGALPGNELDDNNEYGQALLDEVLEARKHMDVISARPSCRLIITSFFLYGSHVALGNQRQAWFFLREATTQYMSGPLEVGGGDLEMQNSSTFSSQLFWLILVSERGHAIRRHRPVTLQITPESPVFDHQGTEGTSSPSTGLGYLVCLFRPFDETFLGPWNRTHSVCSVASLVNIEDRVQQAVPPNLDISDYQLADLRISQQWLRTMVWQLSITLGFLSSHSEHQCMTFQYPLQIARDLVFSTWKLPLQSMEAHGVGLIEKIFEVACTLTDVILCLPQTETKASSGFELGPEDYLKHFISLISKLRGGKTKLLPLLLARVGQALPAMVNPISKHLDLQIPIPPITDLGGRGVEPVATSSIQNPMLMTYDFNNYHDDEDVLGFRNFEMSRTSRSRIMEGAAQQPSGEVAKVFYHNQIPRTGYESGLGPLEIQFRP